MNTTGYRVKDKLAAMRGYRFAMAFENDIAPGYVTEKLLEALAAGCIPIYWGSEEAVRDFNPKAFIFAPAFSTFDEVIAHIKTIEETPDLMRKMAEEPIFTKNEIPFHHTPAFFAEEIKKALDNKLGNLIPTDWNAKMQAQLPREHKRIKRNVSYIKRELKRYLKLNS
jgi:hypothetical protein